MKYVYFMLALIFLSCSSIVGKEHKFTGDPTEEYPYVKVDKFDRWLKTCSKIGCTVYTSSYVSFHNPTDRYVKGKIRCVYYYSGIEHGDDSCRYFSLAPKKSIGVNFTYMFDLVYNTTSKVGVGCDAIYTYNSDISINHVKAGFNNSNVKMYRTKRDVVWITINTPISK
jgi:hypothetical protein